MAHPLSLEQEKEIHSRFQPKEILQLPENLKSTWMNIPPYGPWDSEWIEEILKWIKSQICPSDIAIIQGEYGATFFLVKWLKQKGNAVYYATTERKVIETKHNDGTIETKRVFRHVYFREYP